MSVCTKPLLFIQPCAVLEANTLTHIVNGIYRAAGISAATLHCGRPSETANLAERIAGCSQLATIRKYLDLHQIVVQAAVELA